MSNNKEIIPTHLFIGNEDIIQKTVLLKLQKQFCLQQPTTAGCFCTQCRQIKHKQHPSVVWIKPENNYLLSDLEVIFQIIQLGLDSNQYFFFILEQVHLLSPVCANKLLKTLEEPPNGYLFFLLTNNEQSILPTIRSRCYIHQLSTTESNLFLHPLLSFFIDTNKLNDPFLFDQELRNQKPTEKETIELLLYLMDTIRKRIIDYHKTCYTPRDIELLHKNPKYTQLKTNLNFFHEQLKRPPQAGSASLFWKKLFISFPRTTVKKHV